MKKDTRAIAEELANIVANYHNADIDLFLGSGAYGYAFSTKCGLVIKLTTDRAEVRNAIHMLGKRNKNLSNIYGVYDLTKYKKHYKNAYTKQYFYAIVQEKLDKEYKGVSVADLYSELGKALNETVGEYVTLSCIADKYLKGEIEPELLSKIRKNAKERGIYPQFSNMLELFRQLEDNGITSRDFHSGNIGFKKGRLAMFDLGGGHAYGFDEGHPKMQVISPFEVNNINLLDFLPPINIEPIIKQLRTFSGLIKTSTNRFKKKFRLGKDKTTDFYIQFDFPQDINFKVIQKNDLIFGGARGKYAMQPFGFYGNEYFCERVYEMGMKNDYKKKQSVKTHKRKTSPKKLKLEKLSVRFA